MDRRDQFARRFDRDAEVERKPARRFEVVDGARQRRQRERDSERFGDRRQFGRADFAGSGTAVWVGLKLRERALGQSLGVRRESARDVDANPLDGRSFDVAGAVFHHELRDSPRRVTGGLGERFAVVRFHTRIRAAVVDARPGFKGFRSERRPRRGRGDTRRGAREQCQQCYACVSCDPGRRRRGPWACVSQRCATPASVEVVLQDAYPLLGLRSRGPRRRTPGGSTRSAWPHPPHLRYSSQACTPTWRVTSPPSSSSTAAQTTPVPSG